MRGHTFRLVALSLLIMVVWPPSVCLAEWTLPSLCDLVSRADEIVIGRVVRSVGGDERTASIEVEVEEVWKGSPERLLRVDHVDRGDAAGLRSPFPPLQQNPVGTKLLMFLKKGSGGLRSGALARFEIADSSIKQLWIEEEAVDRYPVADGRAAVIELVLLQTAIAAGTPSTARDGSDSARAVCSVGLCSSRDETLFYAAREVMRRKLGQELRPAIEGALARVKSDTSVARMLNKALAQPAQHVPSPGPESPRHRD